MIHSDNSMGRTTAAARHCHSRWSSRTTHLFSHVFPMFFSFFSSSHWFPPFGAPLRKECQRMDARAIGGLALDAAVVFQASKINSKRPPVLCFCDNRNKQKGRIPCRFSAEPSCSSHLIDFTLRLIVPSLERPHLSTHLFSPLSTLMYPTRPCHRTSTVRYHRRWTLINTRTLVWRESHCTTPSH